MSQRQPKYEIVCSDSFNSQGSTYRRIRALRDFGSVRKGDLGGYVEFSWNLSHDGIAWVADNAIVGDDANVAGNAWVGENARICGSAHIFGNARTSGRALISDGRVCGNAKVDGRANIRGAAYVAGTAEIGGIACIIGHTTVTAGTYTTGVFARYNEKRFLTPPAP